MPLPGRSANMAPMDNRRIIFIVIAVVAVLFLFNPFSRNQGQRVPQPYVDRDMLDSLKNHFTSNYQSPEQLVKRVFATRDVVFISGVGDSSVIKEHVAAIGALIPTLHQNGVTGLGLEYALYADQDKIDRVLSSSTYDEKAVREILFNRHVMWGYQEYADLFKVAWELNRHIASDSEPFRIVGLMARNDWQHLKTQKDLEDAQIKRKILADGLPSVFIARAIQKEFIDKDRKALIFCSAQQVFTHYRNHKYEENTLESGFSEPRSAGNIVYDKIKSRAGTLLLHYIWPDEQAMYQVARPFEGVFDALMKVIEKEQTKAGIQTIDGPFAELPVASGVFAYKQDDLRISGMCQGYIILGPLHEYTTVTPIPEFINAENLQEALRNFPAPKDTLPVIKDPEKDAPRAVQYMNSLIVGYAQNTDKLLEQFK